MPVREREEIQEMPRSLTVGRRNQTRVTRGRTPGVGLVIFIFAIVALAATAHAAIFPDQIGDYRKSAPQTVGVPDRALYDEYGLEASEAADYTGPDHKRFTAAGWHLHDSTGAMALFQSRRPPGAVPASFAALAVRTSDGIIFAYGNYVFQFTGAYPDPATLGPFYQQLTKLENSPLPGLSSYFPTDGRVANSERYILGPVSLQRFDPGIPPSVAAFHLGTEAQLVKYQTAKGLLTVSVFSYPTPSMARQQAEEFQKLPGAVVKRSGPLVAVTLAPPDADAAERILAKINYQATVNIDEKPPVNQVKGFAGMILSIFILAGIILVICVMGGLGFAGVRILSRKMWQKEDTGAMIVLNIEKSGGGKE